LIQPFWEKYLRQRPVEGGEKATRTVRH
jgi:hypothetical protein